MPRECKYQPIWQHHPWYGVFPGEPKDAVPGFTICWRHLRDDWRNYYVTIPS